MEAKQTVFAHGIDFATFIAERTRDFVGRTWLESAVNAWLADANAPAFFMLTGDPGVGKSAFSAHLVRSRPHQISVYHFCSARLGGWIDPLGFTRSMAAQLALRLPDFQSVLLAQEGVHIEATQTIGKLVGGNAVNVLIGNLEVSDAEDGFNRLIRDPLMRLAESGWDEQVVALVDGLDEALAYTGPCTIVDLLARARDLPRFVRILLTSRSEQRVLRYWDDIPHFRIDAGGARNLGDIRSYVTFRMRRVAEQEGQTAVAQDVVERIVDKSAGNFLYVAYLMDTFERYPDTRSLEDLPDGLDGVYRLFLNSRDIGKDLHRWEERFLPVVGVLAVAQEPLSEEHIARFTGLDGQRLAAVVRDLWQYLSLEPGEVLAYRIYHQSFVDFLTNRERAREHWVDARTWHVRIVTVYYGRVPGGQSLPQEADDYAVRHLTAHLEAAGFATALFRLVEDDDWYRRKLAIDASGAAYATDIERALVAAARAGALAYLIAYSLLFAITIEPFTEGRVDQLLQLVAEGRVREALEMANWIARPAHRARVMTAIGAGLGKMGRGEEAGQVWRQALAALRVEGNPVRVIEVARELCAELFEQGEMELAEETLNTCMREIHRILVGRQRFEHWGVLAEMAEKLSGLLKNMGPVMRAIDALIADAAAVRHSVRYYYGVSDHEDPPFSYFDGIWEQCEAIKLAAWHIPRVSDQAWCDDALRRLERIVETIPTQERSQYGYVHDWPGPADSMPRDSETRVKMRKLIAEARWKPEERSAGGAHQLLNYVSRSAAPARPVKSKRLEALKRLEEMGVEDGHTTAAAALGRTLSERASASLEGLYGKDFDQMRIIVARLEPHSDARTLEQCCRELESLARTHSSGYSESDLALSRLLGLLVTLGDCDGALRLLDGLTNNEKCAGWLLAIAWRTVDHGGQESERVLDHVVERAGRLWAMEQKSRVLAGVACVMDERGLSTRAWELVEGIEYQNIRTDAGIALLLSAVARDDLDAAVQSTRRLAGILGSIWAEGEAVRGWLALLACAVWVGNDDMREQYAAALGQALISAGRLEHAAYRSFLFSSGNILQVESTFGILVTQGYAQQALELFVQMQGAFDTRLALQAMGAAALDSRDAAGNQRRRCSAREPAT